MKRDLGWLWHTLAGAALAAVAVLPVPWWLVLPALLAAGFAREVVQHDWWLSLHQWVEAVAWPLGGMLGVALVEVTLWLL